MTESPAEWGRAIGLGTFGASRIVASLGGGGRTTLAPRVAAQLPYGTWVDRLRGERWAVSREFGAIPFLTDVDRKVNLHVWRRLGPRRTNVKLDSISV